MTEHGNEPTPGKEKDRRSGLGAGAGAVGGGVAGAALGAVGGPPGVVFGATVGAVAGGLVGAGEGKLGAAEETYWREHYRDEPYHREELGYEDYAPAYQGGWEAAARHHGRSYEEIEPELRRQYEGGGRGSSRLEWEDARHASRAAWDRVASAMPDEPRGESL